MKTTFIPIIALIVGGFIGFLIAGNSDSGNVDTMDHSMTMDHMMMDMNAELVGKTGADFDKAFIDQMVIHHQGAVEMAELALENAEMQEIKDLAEDIITAQTKEIEMMNEWKAMMQ
jgi:uncharacterized protein (DUF305 family)